MMASKAEERKGVDVTLESYEQPLAASVGMRRELEARSKKLPQKAGAKAENSWTIHIEGAAGEMAVAKYLNVYWSGSVNTFRVGGDVGCLQVRTRSRDNYELLVRDQDRSEDIFILVVGTLPTFRIVGWIQARDAKQSEWKKRHGGRPPAYFVPDAALNDIAILRAMVKSSDNLS